MANVIAFALDSLLAAVIWVLVRWQLEPLRHPPGPLQDSRPHALLHVVPVIGGTLRAGTAFVNLLAYTLALLTTVALFRAESRVRIFAAAAAVVKTSIRSVVVFCLKLLALLAGASMLLTLIYAAGEDRMFIATTGVTASLSAITFAAVAFIISPAAYRLLERQGAPPLNRRDASSLRLTTAACVFAATLAYWGGASLVSRFVPAFEPSCAYFVLSGSASLLLSLVAAVPYGLMFISFAVLSACPDLNLTRIGTAAITEGTGHETMHSPPPPDALV